MVVTEPEKENIVWIDILRVIACLMVIIVHAASTFFFEYKTPEEHFWGNLYGSLVRAGLPLFFILSGILLLPMKSQTDVFLKRRLGRVILPFLFWGTIYSVLTSIKAGSSITRLFIDWTILPLNFPGEGLHLWFVYTLIGLYFFIPVISPWIASVSKRGELAFLTLWTITLFFPFARAALPQFLGEASWNTFGTLYYFSGYLGYLVAGHFIYKYLLPGGKMPLPAAAAIFTLSFLATFGAQEYFFRRDGGSRYEFWDFSSINVAVMAIATVFLVQRIRIKQEWLIKTIHEISNKSFGIYLVHYFVVYHLHEVFVYSGIPAALLIPCNALSTLLISYIIVKAVSLIPNGKYLVG